MPTSDNQSANAWRASGTISGRGSNRRSNVKGTVFMYPARATANPPDSQLALGCLRTLDAQRRQAHHWLVAGLPA